MAKSLTSIRLDLRLVNRARRVLGVKNKTEAIEKSLETIIELDKHRKIIERFSGKGKAGDFRRS